MKKTIKTDLFPIRLLFFIIFSFWGLISLSAQTYQLIATAPPRIQSKADDVNIRFLPNNQIEYYIGEGQWRGWSIAFEWGAPQITYQTEGQLLSISTKGWVVNAGPPHRGATIGVSFEGLTTGNGLLSEGRSYAGFSSSENRYVNNNSTARILMTQWDEPEIRANVFLSDGVGTSILLATYTFRRTDISTASSISLNVPEITHNIVNNGEYWMSIKPSGWLSGYQGTMVQLVTRFYFSNETPLYANSKEATYRDANGYVATATEKMNVQQSVMALDPLIMYIPYRSLNLPYTGGQASYNLFLFIDVFVDGRLQKQSIRAPFTVKW